MLFKIGISVCLFGVKVCFDGGYKISYFVINEFDCYVEFVFVCLEMGMGLFVLCFILWFILENEWIVLVEIKDSLCDYIVVLESYL